ncbi:hypothetical protein Milano_064 [Agrobacterium phage Milano]|nr:hypothetical protein Milano_064 [Agrobacterium phage Milano]
MTRFIRINDMTVIPGVELADEMKKGYVFDSKERREIEGWFFFIGPDGTAHASYDVQEHDYPTEDEVIEHIMYREIDGRRFERRDDDKIERMAEIVAALAAGKKVTL